MTLIGWCPAGRTVAEMLKTYEGTTVARIFVEPGKPLPAWDGPVLGPLVTAGAAVHLSYKTNPLTEVLPWAGRKPAGLLLWLTEDHEPEQGPDAGDPTLDEFHAGQAALVAAFDGHPMRDEIWLGPVFTRYWWQKFAGDLRWLAEMPPWDFIGWDVYNDGSRYRSPDDLLSIPRDIAARTGLPYLIAELGAKDIGPGRPEWMRAMVDAAKADGALTVTWFHKGGCDLIAGTDDARQTWQTIIREETPVATTAPDTLLAARRLLLDHLDMHPGKVVSADLDPAEVGIVGDPAHRGGYHCGSDRVVPRDYSVIESPRDRTGLADWACALDVGQFTVSVAGKRHDLPSFSIWLVAQCKAGTADTRDIREVIYSPDGTTVKRWDRLGKRSSGDDSHRWHTHISFHRDAIKAGRDQTAVFRRYLTTIGLIAAEQEDDIMATLAEVEDAFRKALREALPFQSAGIATANPTIKAISLRQLAEYAWSDAKGARSEVALLRQQLADTVGGDVDEDAIVAGILAGLSPEKIAAAIPAEWAKQVADELAARLAG